jgi:hypothetical protein
MEAGSDMDVDVGIEVEVGGTGVDVAVAGAGLKFPEDNTSEAITTTIKAMDSTAITRFFFIKFSVGLKKREGRFGNRPSIVT